MSFYEIHDVTSQIININNREVEIQQYREVNNRRNTETFVVMISYAGEGTEILSTKWTLDTIEEANVYAQVVRGLIPELIDQERPAS